MIHAIRGTYDLLPGDVEIWHAIEQRLRDILHAYGFGEIRTPILEPTELFVRGVGEETDIVSKEMYTFTDRDETKSLTLRPEGTAPVIRAYFIAPMGDAAFDRATLLARKLRTAGKRVYLDFDARSLKSQMRLADKLKAKSVLIIGEEELKTGVLLLRDMATKEQRNIREEELLHSSSEL